MPGTVLGAGTWQRGKTDENPCLHGAYILVGEIRKICVICLSGARC